MTSTYPNLGNCVVAVVNAAVASSSSSEPPPQLPQECFTALDTPIPPAFDFSLEKQVMQKKEEQDALKAEETSEE